MFAAQGRTGSASGEYKTAASGCVAVLSKKLNPGRLASILYCCTAIVPITRNRPAATAKEPLNASRPYGENMPETTCAGIFCTLSRIMLTYPRKVFFEGRIAFPGKSLPGVEIELQYDNRHHALAGADYSVRAINAATRQATQTVRKYFEFIIMYLSAIITNL
jgi:hypothetical protein